MAVASGRTQQVVYTHSFSSPIGTLHAAVDKRGRVLGLGFSPFDRIPQGTELEENKYACGELEYQVEEYFAGRRVAFSLDVRPRGTDFQKAVWSRLARTGFGETVTYGEIGRRIGRRGAARAVGNAVAANPIVLLIPCHRVVPAAGGIGRFAARSPDEAEGRRVKRMLLDLEAGQARLEV